jgi:hypothetical protein
MQTPNTPAFDQLRELMQAHRINADPVDVAAVMLEIYRDCDGDGLASGSSNSPWTFSTDEGCR